MFEAARPISTRPRPDTTRLRPNNLASRLHRPRGLNIPVAGIMDYPSILAYSLIKYKSTFLQKTVVEFKYFLVFFYLCFVTKCSYPIPCPFIPFVVCFIYCLCVSRLYILYICALRVGQMPLKTT